MPVGDLEYSRDWTRRNDFPTYVDNENQVRADMQYLFTEIQNYINNELKPGILQDAAALSLSGVNVLTLEPFSSRGVTDLQIQTLSQLNATAAELNQLNGAVVTASELNQLHSSGIQKSDLVKLHGVTASADELNVLDGTTAETEDLDKLHSVTASAAELNVLDGSTAVTSDLNTLHTKASVLGDTTAPFKTSDAAELAQLRTDVDSKLTAASLVPELLSKVYPVGSVYMSVNNVDPGTFLGGTWEQLKDRFLLGAGDTYTAGDTDGEATHTLTMTEMPRHRHDYYAITGDSYGDWRQGTSYYLRDYYNSTTYAGGQSDGTTKPHNNMPPYLVVYMWKRTA